MRTKLSLIAALLCLSTSVFANKAFPEVSLDELKGIVASKSATIIDANGVDTYNEGHIPTAINFAQTKDLASALPKDKNALIVAYCGGPMCTAWEKPAEQASKMGYTNIKHFKGGIKGWKNAKQPTEGKKG